MTETKYSKIFTSEKEPIWPSPFEVEEPLLEAMDSRKKEKPFLKVYLEILVIILLMIGVFAPLTLPEENNTINELVSEMPTFLPIKPVKMALKRIKKGFPVERDKSIIPMTRSQKELLPYHQQVRMARMSSPNTYAKALFKRAEVYHGQGQYQLGIQDLKHGYRLLIQELYGRLKRAEQIPNLATMSTLLEQIEALQSEANAMLNIYIASAK